MNFFHRHNNPTPLPPTSPSPAPSPSPKTPTPPPSLPPTDTPTPPPTPPPPTPPPPTPPPPSSEHPRKSRFPRLRNPLSRKPTSPSDKPHNTTLPTPLPSTHTNTQTPDPEKLARRAARRAERQRLHDEWVEQNRQLRKQAVAINRPFEPLPEPPHINSDSEDDNHQHPDAVTSHPPAQNSQVNDVRTVEMGDAQDDVGNGISVKGVHSAEFGPAVPVVDQTEPDSGQTAALDGAEGATVERGDAVPVPPAPVRDFAAEAKMAEMFGRQAYAGVGGEVEVEVEDGAVSGGARVGDGVEGGVTVGSARVGWGDAYGSVPSLPMYGNPMMSYVNPPVDVDYVLSEKIRRGRELGRLSVVQEEQGNMGAAESGYMKALELLVPAARELDVGSELTRNARLNMKKKVQREAAAMLDRVEEIKVFLKANGPAVPDEMPVIPVTVPSPPRGRDGGYGDPEDGGEPGARGRLRQPGKRHPNTSTSKPPSRPPPPPPPPFGDNESGELARRLSQRKNVLSTASIGFHSVGVSGLTSNPSSKVPRAGTANCFMCNAPATVVAPCDHTFCKSCGRQAASVFGNCPVPGCGEPLSAEIFSELQ